MASSLRAVLRTCPLSMLWRQFLPEETFPPRGTKQAHELSGFRNLREMSKRSQTVRTDGERVGHPNRELPVRHAESHSNAAFMSGQPHWSGLFHDATALESPLLLWLSP